MAIDLAPAANVWAGQHPRLVEATTRLEEGGDKVALFASALHEIVSIALDIPLERQPEDADLLVCAGQFGTAADVLGAVTLKKRVSFRSSDGFSAEMIVREGLVRIGGDDVQFMEPLTSLRVGSHQYDTAFTKEAAAARTVVETDYGLLPLAHLTDAISIYAIGQRPGDKDDARKTATLLRADPFADAYSARRSIEMGWDRRVWEFVWTAGRRAVDLAGVAPMRETVDA